MIESSASPYSRASSSIGLPGTYGAMPRGRIPAPAPPPASIRPTALAFKRTAAGIRAEQLQERRALAQLGERRSDAWIVADGLRDRRRRGTPTSRCARAAIRGGSCSRRAWRDGSSSAYIAPGRFCADMTSEVSSLPDGPAAWRPSTQKRVVLLGSSSMCAAMHLEPIDRGRRFAGDRGRTGSATAASRAASALLATGTRAARGRWRASHCTHCASDCACE